MKVTYICIVKNNEVMVEVNASEALSYFKIKCFNSQDIEPE